MSGVETRVYPDAEALAAGASLFMVENITAALGSGQQALIVLSGGSTPEECYRRLAKLIRERGVALDRLLWAFGDERWVPVGHRDSNEGMARRTLLGPIGAPEETILSWHAGTGDPRECAEQYGARLARGRPSLLLLGLGADGHTASLFPGAVALLPTGMRAPVSMDIHSQTAAVWVPKEGRWRLTLCPPYMNRSRTVAFLATGAAKRESLARVLGGDSSVPGAWVRGQDTLFLVTRDCLGRDTPDFSTEVRHA